MWSDNLYFLSRRLILNIVFLLVYDPVWFFYYYYYYTHLIIAVIPFKLCETNDENYTIYSVRYTIITVNTDKEGINEYHLACDPCGRWPLSDRSEHVTTVTTIDNNNYNNIITIVMATVIVAVSLFPPYVSPTAAAVVYLYGYTWDVPDDYPSNTRVSPFPCRFCRSFAIKAVDTYQVRYRLHGHFVVIWQWFHKIYYRDTFERTYHSITAHRNVKRKRCAWSKHFTSFACRCLTLETWCLPSRIGCRQSG